MKAISVLEFRKNARKILRWAKQGKRMVMTYRGQPVCRIEPIVDEAPAPDDPFYQLAHLADDNQGNLNNTEIDSILYEKL